MGVVGKSFAFVMFPLSILIVLDETGVYSLALPFDKILIGAALMIVLQLITLFMVKVKYETLSIMGVLTAAVFIAAAAAAILARSYSFFPKETSLILGVIMLIEALYALH